MKNNECCIINTDDDKSNGVHWCGLYINIFHIFTFMIHFLEIVKISLLFVKNIGLMQILIILMNPLKKMIVVKDVLLGFFLL